MNRLLSTVLGVLAGIVGVALLLDTLALAVIGQIGGEPGPCTDRAASQDKGSCGGPENSYQCSSAETESNCNNLNQMSELLGNVYYVH